MTSRRSFITGIAASAGLLLAPSIVVPERRIWQVGAGLVVPWPSLRSLLSPEDRVHFEAALPTTPTGRVTVVQYWFERGLISHEQARALLDFPLYKALLPSPFSCAEEAN